MGRFREFLIYWFWWKWRALLYYKATDRFRKEIFEKIKGQEPDYFYLGMGSVLKHKRDHDLTLQDLDFVISRTDFEQKNSGPLLKNCL